MKGKQIGEFSLKCITITVSPGPGGSTILAGNYEGTVSDVGVIFLTASFVGRQSGTWSATGYVFAADGQTISTTATGQ